MEMKIRWSRIEITLVPYLPRQDAATAATFPSGDNSVAYNVSPFYRQLLFHQSYNAQTTTIHRALQQPHVPFVEDSRITKTCHPRTPHTGQREPSSSSCLLWVGG